MFNAAVEGITSMLLALACAGVDVTKDDVLQSAWTAIESAGNEWS